MTERKPHGDSWDNWIESQIRVAMEQGDFDNPPGRGKPLPDHGQEFDPMWRVKQLAEREQLSVLPTALELRRKVESELAAIGKFNATVLDGPSTNFAKLDIDQVIEKWRRARVARRSS